MTPRALFHPARLARRPVLSTQSDERLVDLVRDGNEPRLRDDRGALPAGADGVLSRLLSPERAEDAVQQAFVNAYDAMHSGDAEIDLRPWLYRIAHNAALNALRAAGAPRRASASRWTAWRGPARPSNATKGCAPYWSPFRNCPRDNATRFCCRHSRAQLRGDRRRARGDRRRRATAPEPGAELVARGGRRPPPGHCSPGSAARLGEPVADRVAQTVGVGAAAAARGWPRSARPRL